MNRSWLFCAALAAALGCNGRPRHYDPSEASPPDTKSDKRRIVELNLTSGAPETQSGNGLFRFPASQSFTGLVRSIERVQREDKLAGVFVRLGEASLDFPQSEEIGELLGKVRAKGKPVVCHAHTLTNSASLIVARGCSKVWLSPAGELASIGIAAQMVYLKPVLDKLKIGVDFLAMGKYKSGAEPLTRDGPSENARVSLTETLAAIRSAWLDESVEARKNPGLRDALEHGPFSAGEARERGLVDEIGFEAEAIQAAKQAAKVEVMEASFGPRASGGGGFDIGEIVRVLAGVDKQSSAQPHVAVVPAEGGITMDSGGVFDQSGITAKALGKTLHRLAQDSSVKAVVLRLNSPGGSPLASDLLWHEAMELRKKKPLIVSIGNMAASGGYYIACAGQRIFAERTSIVGSIGVFGGKIIVGPALEAVGIHGETFPASPEPGAAARAAFGSPLLAWDEPTRDRVRAQMRSIYDLFIARVAHGRRMEPDKVRAAAEGRIWSGGQGLEQGLVDELGGLSAALAAAQKLAGLREDSEVTVEGGRDSLIERLLLDDDASGEDVARALARLDQSSGARIARELPRELWPFLASLTPLTNGEHLSVALPFALTLH